MPQICHTKLGGGPDRYVRMDQSCAGSQAELELWSSVLPRPPDTCTTWRSSLPLLPNIFWVVLMQTTMEEVGDRPGRSRAAESLPVGTRPTDSDTVPRYKVIRDPAWDHLAAASLWRACGMEQRARGVQQHVPSGFFTRQGLIGQAHPLCWLPAVSRKRRSTSAASWVLEI